MVLSNIKSMVHQASAPSDELGALGRPPGVNATAGDVADMGKSYDTYIASGLYRSRYPRPNRRTLRLLQQNLPAGVVFSTTAPARDDCLNLARTHAAHVFAVDISAAARHVLATRAEDMDLARSVAICEPGDPIYRAEVGERGRFDVALLGFGVLGHVAERKHRIALLSELRDALSPGGCLVLGLPNALRRFRTEQAQHPARVASGELEAGDIYYQRVSSAGTVPLFYHLFHRAEIQADLAEAGYSVERLTSESMLPETAVTNSGALAVVDDLACSALQADWGYGYLFTARPGK
jgi:SAM-dependent methyltransferase